MDRPDARVVQRLHVFHGAWLVPASRLSDRLDAKSLLPWSVGQLEPQWAEEGIASDVLEQIVDPANDAVAIQPDAHYTFLRVNYEGRAEAGETALGREISYSKIGRARVGDLVASHINAVNKAICVVPEGMDGYLVSNEYTVMRLKPGVEADPLYIWSVLRSTAVIAEWLSGASGVGRTRIDWDMLKKQRVPLLALNRQREIGAMYRQAETLERQSLQLRESAAGALDVLNLESAAAKDRMVRAKPPR